jgi:hypothetical protein
LKNTCVRGKRKNGDNNLQPPPPQIKPSSFTRGEINAKCKESKICAMKSCDGNPAEEDLNNSNGVKDKIEENTCEDLQIQGTSK